MVGSWVEFHVQFCSQTFSNAQEAKGSNITSIKFGSCQRNLINKAAATRSRRFMDAYDRGLNGSQAAWAARKYRGHRVLPQNILDQLEKEGIV